MKGVCLDQILSEGSMFGPNGRLMRSGDRRSILEQTEKRLRLLPPTFPGYMNLYWGTAPERELESLDFTTLVD